jgi:hypothetical protein
MNLSDLTSGTPETKPWLAVVAGSLDVGSLTADSLALSGRLLQNTTRLTPYGLWSTLGNSNIVGMAAQSAMGTFVGSVSIPAAECYPGMTTTIKVVGHVTSLAPGGASNILIRNLANTYAHASCQIQFLGTIMSGKAISAEFVIQIPKIGGLGVAEERFGACGQVGEIGDAATGGAYTYQGNDAAGFSTLAGVEYALFVSNSGAGDTTFIRLASATVTY